jgi:hypothetical protein
MRALLAARVPTDVGRVEAQPRDGVNAAALTAVARFAESQPALLRAPDGCQRRTEMFDAIMLAVAVAFFALAITYASACDRM